MSTTPTALTVSSTIGAVRAAVQRAATSGPRSRATTAPQSWLARPASEVAATAPHSNAPKPATGARARRHPADTPPRTPAPDRAGAAATTRPTPTGTSPAGTV